MLYIHHLQSIHLYIELYIYINKLIIVYRKKEMEITTFHYHSYCNHLSLYSRLSVNVLEIVQYYVV